MGSLACSSRMERHGPANIDDHYYQDPFDSALTKAEAGRCGDVESIAHALGLVREVVFEHEGPTMANKSDDDATPSLVFASVAVWRVRGQSAGCPWKKTAPCRSDSASRRRHRKQDSSRTPSKSLQYWPCFLCLVADTRCDLRVQDLRPGWPLGAFGMAGVLKSKNSLMLRDGSCQ